jgi:hypothetical protein
MPHKFNGTWSHFKLSEAFPPAGPTRANDFILYIDDAGTFDLQRSRVDGRKIRTASVDGETSFLITAVDGRQYKGVLVRELVECNDSVLVMAGRFQDGHEILDTKTKAKKGPTPFAQNEGDWVITKP